METFCVLWMFDNHSRVLYLSTVSLDEQVSLHVVIFIQKCFKDAQVINVLFDEDVTWSHWEVSQAPPY